MSHSRIATSGKFHPTCRKRGVPIEKGMYCFRKSLCGRDPKKDSDTLGAGAVGACCGVSGLLSRTHHYPQRQVAQQNHRSKMKSTPHCRKVSLGTPSHAFANKGLHLQPARRAILQSISKPRVTTPPSYSSRVRNTRCGRDRPKVWIVVEGGNLSRGGVDALEV